MKEYKISDGSMRRVYEEMKTPKKLGMVLCQEGCELDCPTVFRRPDGSWGMIFARYVPGEERTGYETWMAVSDDLIRWKVQGKLLEKRAQGWDCCQADGGLCLIDSVWGGSQKAEKFEGRYWMTYIGGALPGYETDPLSIGMACSKTLEPGSWERLEAPILQPTDGDAREFEKATLYKSTVIHDEKQQLGAPFVMFYNAKQKGLWVERIGIAVSGDMRKWKRLGTGPVVDNGDRGVANIAGDPQIVRYGDLWVMHYFVAEGGTAYDTFACSRDLLHWTRWEGEPLIAPTESYDKTYAHKPYVLKHEGKVYHFYCAVGDRGRGIAVAVSQ